MTPWRALMQSLAYRLSRLAATPRPTTGVQGALLSDDRRSGSVVLIWALDLAADDPALATALASMRQARTVLVVSDAIALVPPADADCFIEYLPDAALRARAPGPDWPDYLQRRIARLRLAWAPDFEVTLAQGPEAYLAAVARDGDALPPGVSLPVSDGADGMTLAGSGDKRGHAAKVDLRGQQAGIGKTA